jgi:hypothetical protein
MNIFNDEDKINDIEDESLPGNAEEQKSIGGDDIPEEPRRRNRFKSKKLIVIIALAFIAGALVFILKGIFFKQGPVIRHANFFPKKQTKHIFNESPSFPAVSGKPVQTKPGVVTPEALKTVNTGLVKKKNSAKKSKGDAGGDKISTVPEVPLMPIKSIKKMMEFNSRVNELGERLKIARLEQEIKSLNNAGSGVINNTSLSNISLVAVTKNTAIIAFGKRNVSMRVGMNYEGYKCLMISPKGVALEKNNKVVNLSLSM